jgi:NAD(P)-dependent dehydrogenase (short-subunit alcohol dehydrogenase family)
MKVVLADADEATLQRTAAELKAEVKETGTVLAVRTDVSQRDEVEALAQTTIDTFGAVHLLFNNAGIAAGASAWEASWNDWEWVLGVNLWGVIHGVKIFTPLMLAQQTECHIVNTASAAGLISGSFSAPYGVSKHAVVALSENLYLTLQQKQSLVKASVLCPGVVRTNIHNTESYRPDHYRNPPPPESSTAHKPDKAAIDAVLALAMSSDTAADLTFEAIRNDQFYILTDPRWLEAVKLRTQSLNSLRNPVSPTEVVMRIVRPQS